MTSATLPLVLSVPWAFRAVDEAGELALSSYVAPSSNQRRGGAGAGENDGGVPPGFALIGPAPTLRKAQEWLFVLTSVGLDGAVRQLEGGYWALLVLEHNHAKALATLRSYEAENRDWPPRAPRDRPVYELSWFGAAMFGALAIFHGITGPSAQHGRYFGWGTADASHILHGRWFEAITALTLHADAGHVLGNALAGTVFVTAVHRRLGAGLGTLVVLAAGAAGNLLNALWHPNGHRSIGASTAVFAAVGVLAATQLVINRATEARDRASRFRVWGPLVGGLALLGTLGSSPHSDLHAHGFGFAAGLVLGLVAALPLRGRTTPLSWVTQSAFGVASLAAVLGAWALAIWR